MPNPLPTVDLSGLSSFNQSRASSEIELYSLPILLDSQFPFLVLYRLNNFFFVSYEIESQERAKNEIP
jgi:hypothetical protein